MLDKVIQKLPDVRKYDHDSSELRQRIAKATFPEAVEIVKQNTSPLSVKEVMTSKGLVVVFDYGNDNKII
jgi:hypothetical protein